MPASWRPSRGKGYELDEIRGLSGVDRMTIPPNLLTELANCQDPLPRKLEAAAAAAACTAPPLGGGRVEEKATNYQIQYMLTLYRVHIMGTDFPDFLTGVPLPAQSGWLHHGKNGTGVKK